MRASKITVQSSRWIRVLYLLCASSAQQSWPALALDESGHRSDSCQAALESACPAAHYGTAASCTICAGKDQAGLHTANCSAASVSRYCGERGRCTTMAQLRANMPRWAGVVPYSHLTNKTWGYPTDCGGFVSWALQTKALAWVARNLKAYEFGAPIYSDRIPIDQLHFGDVITHVWDHSVLQRCSNGGGALPRVVGDNGAGEVSDIYISGHVFFFDRWADANRSAYWAYESTETEGQTKACKAQTGSLTRSLCFNHHARKLRHKTIDKWSDDNCTDEKYGFVSGGAHRLSPRLLCPE